MGLVAIAAPPQDHDLFANVAPTAPQRNEIRAVYGGTGFAWALILGFALAVPSVRQALLVSTAIVFAAMGFGRTLSFLIERPERRTVMLLGFVALEFGLAMMLYIASTTA
ncbi:MAG: DUF4345 family protein [Polyangiales bacterium]